MTHLKRTEVTKVSTVVSAMVIFHFFRDYRIKFISLILSLMPSLTFGQIPPSASRKLQAVYLTADGRVVVVDRAAEKPHLNENASITDMLAEIRRADTDMRVYVRVADNEYEAFEVANVQTFRGPPGTIIQLKNGSVLKTGFLGRVEPSFDGVKASHLPTSPQTIEELAVAKVINRSCKFAAEP